MEKKQKYNIKLFLVLLIFLFILSTFFIDLTSVRGFMECISISFIISYFMSILNEILRELRIMNGENLFRQQNGKSNCD